MLIHHIQHIVKYLTRRVYRVEQTKQSDKIKNYIDDSNMPVSHMQTTLKQNLAAKQRCN